MADFCGLCNVCFFFDDVTFMSDNGVLAVDFKFGVHLFGATGFLFSNGVLAGGFTKEFS
jgi:hypothetical protein